MLNWSWARGTRLRKPPPKSRASGSSRMERRGKLFRALNTLIHWCQTSRAGLAFLWASHHWVPRRINRTEVSCSPALWFSLGGGLSFYMDSGVVGKDTGLRK